MISIKEACEICKKWLPPINEIDKLSIKEYLLGSECRTWRLFIKEYIKLIKPYEQILNLDNPKEDDCIASGIGFFYGCLLFIMHFPNWGNHIYDIFLYNILYILVDHFIDDMKSNPENKDKVINQMFILISNPSAKLDFADPSLKVIAETYSQLITRCPLTKISINKLFLSEIEGLKIQKSPDFSREDYYGIALKKGGYTLEVLVHIMGITDNEIIEEAYKIAQTMQLIDDIVDAESDINNGINTVATYDLTKNGNLDLLWLDVVNRINNLHPKFTIFKIVYSFFAVYLPDRCRKQFSPEVYNKTTKLNLFDYNYGCDASSLLVSACMEELIILSL